MRSILLCLGALSSSALLLAAEVTFHEHVAPIVKRSCLACHAGDEPKADLSLETLEKLMAGGKNGPPVVPGKPEESLLYLLTSRQRKPAMPPKREDALGAQDVAVVKAWIEGGARAGEAPRERAPYSEPIAAPSYSRPCPVTALAYSPDGKRLFVSGHREILVHEAEPAAAEASSLLSRWAGEAERLNALQVSPDGSLLAAAGGTPGLFGELQLWSLETGNLARFHRTGRDTLFAAAFSPDGARIALCGAERSVRVIDAASLKELHAAELHSDWVFGAAFSADGSRLVSSGRDKTVKVLEGVEGKLLSNLATLDDPVLALRARPGTAQAAAGGGRTPILFDLKDLKEVRKYEAQPGQVLAMAFSPDGSLLAVGGSSQEVRVYQAEDGGRKLTLRTGSEWTYALAFRPDGERLAAAGYEGVVRIFGLKDDKEIRTFVPAPITPAKTAPERRAPGEE